jgi:hypothetical protein
VIRTWGEKEIKSRSIGPLVKEYESFGLGTSNFRNLVYWVCKVCEVKCETLGMGKGTVASRLGTLDQLRRHKRRLITSVIHEGIHGFRFARIFPNDLTVFIENIDEFFDDDLFIVFRDLIF